VPVVPAIALFCCPGLGSAQIITSMYDFESPDLDGFTVNGVLSTVSLNTDTNFVSQGAQSLKWELMTFASFEGAQTSNIDPGILNDPPGVDFIRFDLINTNRYVPDAPVPGTDPTFASISVNVFGEFASNPGVGENIQFFGSEVPVGILEPGTHELDVDVTGGGLLIGTATVKGFNDYIADGLTVTGFQFYLNKSVGFTPPFAWTVYLDDVRTGRAGGGGFLAGDYNGNDVLDAADYTVWRDALTAGSSSLLNDPTPGTVDESDFVYWRDHFGDVPGSGAGSASAVVPEPASGLLLLVGAVLLCVTRRGRTIR
jgi:hypothetical protein